MEHPYWPQPTREALGLPPLADVLAESAELDALIQSMRTSAQDTLDALHRRGFKIVKA